MRLPFITIATTAQALPASTELANNSTKQAKNLVGKSGKKLQRFLRDASACGPSGYRASSRLAQKNPFAFVPAIRQILV
jgi:hypothetical protein